MATGDQEDILARLKSAIPFSWFGDESPVIDGILSGFAYIGSLIYSLIEDAKLQTRISTATGGFLDLVAGDFFGAWLTRNPNESDYNFRTRILLNLTRERTTRAALITMLEDLTGRTPIVIEPGRAADNGAYGYISGYGSAGYYGSLSLPCQCFVIAYRPNDKGAPLVAGYGYSMAGYGVASYSEYADLETLTENVVDDQIYEAINDVKPVGSTVWTRISD